MDFVRGAMLSVGALLVLHGCGVDPGIMGSAGLGLTSAALVGVWS